MSNTKKTFNPYDFASVDKRYLFIAGVYHKDGYTYATDGRFAFKIKDDYPADLESKIIAEDGSVIDARFPIIERVLPSDNQLEVSSLTLKDFKKARSVTTAKTRCYLQSIRIDMGESKFQALIIDRVIKFWTAYPDAKLYKNKTDEKQWLLKDKEKDASLVFMPLWNDTSCTHKYDVVTKKCIKLEE